MIHDIKPEPTNAWGLHKNWMNWMTAKLISESSFSKRIKVVYAHYEQDFSEPWECEPDDPRINDIDTNEPELF